MTARIHLWATASGDTEPWLVEDLGNWRVAFRLCEQNGTLVIAEARVFPAEPRQVNPFGGPGQWTEDAESVPKGGLTARTLRELTSGLPRHRDAARRALEQLAAQFQDREAGERLLSRYKLSPRSLTPPPHPGRRGHPDIYFARLAASYVKLCQRNDPTPVATLAKSNHLSRTRMRDLLHEARNRELLTAAPLGSAGGHLTAKAIELLKADQSTKRRRR